MDDKDYKMRKLITFALSSLLLVIASACASAAPPPTPTPTAIVPNVTLTVTGNSTLLRVLESIQPAFEADVPTHQLEILFGDNIDANPEFVADETLDAIAVSGTFEAEVTEVVGEDTARNLQGLTFGRSALAILVHSSQSVTDLSVEQVADIFSGAVTNWSQVGGEDVPIQVYTRDAERGSTADFLDGFMDGQTFDVLRADKQVLQDSSDLLDAISADPNGIGYANLAGTAPQGLNVTSLSIGGISPLDDTYFSFEPLLLVYRNGDDDIQPLVDWLMSNNGRAALRVADVSDVAATEN
jgi:phosphate transport system substrate-binding protein